MQNLKVLKEIIREEISKCDFQISNNLSVYSVQQIHTRNIMQAQKDALVKVLSDFDDYENGLHKD